MKKNNRLNNLIVATALPGLNTHIYFNSTRAYSTNIIKDISYPSPLNHSLGLGELHHIIIGLMLGDGSLYRSSPTANVRFEMSLGQNYEEFALELGDIFKDYMSNPVKALEIKGETKSYTNFRLKTRSLPIFLKYYNMFYEFNLDSNKYVKIIPKNIDDLMNSIVLAYLIMTDGNFDKGRNRVRIYTNSYTKEEIERLALAINKKLGIYTGVLHDRNNQWILTIGAKYLNLLRDNVSKHFHKSMLYRIGL
jgi:LAGLIDADG DNA endonuclease family